MEYKRILDQRCLLAASVEDDNDFEEKLKGLEINSLIDAIKYSAELDMIIPEIEEEYSYVPEWEKILKQAKEINKKIIKKYNSEKFIKGKEKYKDIYFNDDFMKNKYNWLDGVKQVNIHHLISFDWQKKWNWQKSPEEEFTI